MKRMITFFYVLQISSLSFANVCYLDNEGIKTVFETQGALEYSAASLADPDYGVGERAQYLTDEERQEFEVAREFNRWAVEYNSAMFDFVSGNIKSFEVRLGALHSRPSPTAHLDIWAAKNLLKLYAVAVEAGVDTMDVTQVEGLWERARVLEDDSLLIESTVAYLLGDTITLDRIAQELAIRSPSQFETGYINLLAAKSTGSKDRLIQAVELLTELEEKQSPSESGLGSGCQDLRHGRIALHLADAHLLALKVVPEDETHLERAVFFARQARQELELLISPVMWGRAHQVSSQIFQTLSNRTTIAGQRAAHQLAANRSYELSVLYQ